MSEQLPKVGIGVYIFKDGKLLLGKRKGSHGAGEYATPGGRLENGESWAACASRETLEETGLRIGQAQAFRVDNELAYLPKHWVDIAVRAEWIGGEPEVREPDKVESWGWYDLNDLPKPLFATIASALDVLRDGSRGFRDSFHLVSPVDAPPTGRLQIYFATSIRGGADYAHIRRRIAFFETIGDVLTKHMVSPSTVDMGHRSDQEIYRHDQELLARAQVFIADRIAPSEGTAFMASRAVQLGIPVIYLHPRGTGISAMIHGCPNFSVEKYVFDAGFEQQVRAGLMRHATRLLQRAAFTPPRIFLAGPPGSGKGTLGAALAKSTGMVHVSTGELLRTIVSVCGSSSLHTETIQQCMDQGVLVPADVMRDIVLERLQQDDCRMFGFILDGYPPSREDLQNLRDAGVTPNVVFYLDCGDGTAVNRIVKRSARTSDNPKTAQRRVEVFHQADMGFDTLATEWFSDRMVVRVDAELPPHDVHDIVRETVDRLFGSAERDASFFPVLRSRDADARSTRFHFHIDAKDAETVRRIAKDVYAAYKPAQGRMKMYPIQHLQLGPQEKELAIYRQLPNFHDIADASSEAFITGHLGDMDTEFMLAVLEAAKRHGGMAELEQYLGEWTLTAGGDVREEHMYSRIDFDHRIFRDYVPQLCSSIPPVELHLGFDIPKDGSDGPLPIALDALIAACHSRGINNGGWFIFKNRRHWAYRSNEFTFEEPNCAVARLFEQACALRDILGAFGYSADISYSIELVHGIWVAK